MPACIIERETHPDRGTNRIIGPFDTYAEAERIAMELYYHDSNKIPNSDGSRWSNYYPMDLESPTEC